jgi:hypothetical protein
MAIERWRPRRGMAQTEPHIVAIGSGKILENGKVRQLDVKEGDRVMFGKYSGRMRRSRAKTTSCCARTIFSASSKGNSMHDQATRRSAIQRNERRQP